MRQITITPTDNPGTLDLNVTTADDGLVTATTMAVTRAEAHALYNALRTASSAPVAQPIEYVTMTVRGTVYVDVAPNANGSWSVVHNTTEMMRFTPDAWCDPTAGVEIHHVELADGADDTDGLVEALADTLDVADTDGRFWQAVQVYLGQCMGSPIDWVE